MSKENVQIDFNCFVNQKPIFSSIENGIVCETREKNDVADVLFFMNHQKLTSCGKKGACKLTQMALPKSASPIMINVNH